MTGLEKILKVIDEESQAAADAIIKEAKMQAEEILSAAKQEAEQQCALIADKTAADIKSIISRAESNAALQEKKAILEAKQQIINDTLLKARTRLTALPDSEYTEIIIKLVKKYSHNTPGTILFSASDKKRLPADFNNRLHEALSGKTGAALTISDSPADINGGFLLVYGDIEENCSFDALFEAAKEDLQDKVNSFLFN